MSFPSLNKIARACLTGIALAAQAATVLAAAAPLQPESLKVDSVPPRGDHWFYALDLGDLVNGRLVVYATRQNGREALMTTTLDGKIKARLAGQGGDIREPDWGPFQR